VDLQAIAPDGDGIIAPDEEANRLPVGRSNKERNVYDTSLAGGEIEIGPEEIDKFLLRMVEKPLASRDELAAAGGESRFSAYIISRQPRPGVCVGEGAKYEPIADILRLRERRDDGNQQECENPCHGNFLPTEDRMKILL